MREVSTNSLRQLLSAMERAGVPLGPLLQGLPANPFELPAPGGRVDWQVWVEIITRLESSLGGPDALEEFVVGAATGPVLHPFQRIAQLFSSPIALYRFNSRWGIPNAFRNLRSTCEGLGPGRLRISLSLPESYPGSRAVFQSAAGVLRALPKLIGLPESKIISRDLSTHHLTMVLDPPQSRTLLSQAGRLTRRLGGLRSMLEQLGEQELELDQKSKTLEQQLEEQRRVEAALRVSEERWRALAENAPGTILLLSVDGEIASASRPFLGIESRALIGRPLSELVARTDRAKIDTAIAEVCLNRKLYDVEFEVLEQASREVWYSCRLGPIDQGNGELMISAFLTDITERVRTTRSLREREAELLRAQKLEALGRLAGGVAHDFNNLLTVIRGGADLLLRGPWLAREQREEVEQIKKAGERAASLTRQLLAFTRQQVIAPEVFVLDQVVQGAKGMLERLIGEGIRLEVRPNSSPWCVKLDRSQLEQILMNLVVNARDAMPRGGTLTIATQNLERNAAFQLGASNVEAGSYVELSVHDTGLGMDDHTSERIFEPFYSTKQPGAGTGLGLAIVRGIVTQSGGHIAVESRLGQGTVFYLCFPRSLEAAMTTPVTEPAVARGSGETILLVEDDPQVRALVRRILGNGGYRVIECKGAAEALVNAKHQSIDLLLTDVVMPELGGPELARLLMERQPELTVLFMSGYAEHEIVHRGLVDPGVSLLSKPFTPDSLSRSVRTRLDERALTRRKSG